MNILDVKVGATGQIKGPFTLGETVINFAGYGGYVKMRLGIVIDEKDLMAFFNRNTNQSLEVHILSGANEEDNLDIYIGQSGIYDPDEAIVVAALSFPDGAPASTTIDYIILGV